MNSFIIEKIQSISENKLALTIKIDGDVSVFEITFHNQRGVSLPEGLDLLFMHKDFDYHKQFLKIISDCEAGKSITLPIDLFKNPVPKKELIAA